MEKRYKIVVYAPEDHADKLREAMGNAGAGRIGKYSYCTFTLKGIGRSKPEEGANPTIGEVGISLPSKRCLLERSRLKRICTTSSRKRHKKPTALNVKEESLAGNGRRAALPWRAISNGEHLIERTHVVGLVQRGEEFLDPAGNEAIGEAVHPWFTKLRSSMNQVELVLVHNERDIDRISLGVPVEPWCSVEDLLHELNVDALLLDDEHPRAEEMAFGLVARSLLAFGDEDDDRAPGREMGGTPQRGVSEGKGHETLLNHAHRAVPD